MFNIADYLNKFKGLGFKESLIRETIICMIKERWGIILEKTHIELKNSVVVVKGDSALRSALFVNKKALVEEINQRVPGGKIMDIR